jgi:hypothetical protein
MKRASKLNSRSKEKLKGERRRAKVLLLPFFMQLWCSNTRIKNMLEQDNNNFWILRISKKTADIIMRILISCLGIFALFYSAKMIFTYKGTRIIEEVLAPNDRRDFPATNFVARTLEGRKSEYLRVVRFIGGKETDSRDIHFRYLTNKWVSGRHLRICSIGGIEEDARGEIFTEQWFELKITYRLNFFDWEDIQKNCLTKP